MLPAVCRPLLTTRQLHPVLAQHPTLEALTLAFCPGVSDRSLETLPAHSLKKLMLLYCDGIQGTCLSRLTRLEVLSVSWCKAVTEEAIQVRAATKLCIPIVGEPFLLKRPYLQSKSFDDEWDLPTQIHLLEGTFTVIWDPLRKGAQWSLCVTLIC